MFWSGDKLNSKCRDLVYYDSSDGQTDTKIDCASIVLTVGDECYVTGDVKKGFFENIFDYILSDSERNIIHVIPKGQFGLILTREYVKVPKEAIAFISFKAKYKFLGLINVSGFHVDPGWDGKLVFSVYNAGPTDIKLKRGDDFALIWYADLDQDSSIDYVKNQEKPQRSIKSDFINNMSGDIFSPSSLKKEIDEVRVAANTAVERSRLWAWITMFALFLTIVSIFIRFWGDIGDLIISDSFVDKVYERIEKKINDNKN